MTDEKITEFVLDQLIEGVDRDLELAKDLMLVCFLLAGFAVCTTIGVYFLSRRILQLEGSA
jgi:hypothetical protein